MRAGRPCAMRGLFLVLAVADAAPIDTVTIAHALTALERGIEAMSLAKLQYAVGIFGALARQEGAECEVHAYLARAFAGMGAYYEMAREPEGAVSSLKRGVDAAEIAIRCDSKNAEYHTILGEVHGMLASHSSLVGQIRHGQRSATAYAHAVELDPENPRARVGVGIGKLETPELFGGSVDAALENFRLAQALDPACAEAWIWEGIALRREGAIPEARAAFVRALEVAPYDRQAQRELAGLEEDFE